MIHFVSSIISVSILRSDPCRCFLKKSSLPVFYTTFCFSVWIVWIQFSELRAPLSKAPMVRQEPESEYSMFHSLNRVTVTELLGQVLSTCEKLTLVAERLVRSVASPGLHRYSDPPLVLSHSSILFGLYCQQVWHFAYHIIELHNIVFSSSWLLQLPGHSTWKW